MAATAALASHEGIARACGDESHPNGATTQDEAGLPKPQEQEKKRLPHQEKVEVIYNGVPVQVAVACLIGANFLTNIIEKQIDPGGTDSTAKTIFEALDIVYNVAFTIELCVNLYAHWFWTFWKSGWNTFDTVVVTIGVINLLKLPLPKAFSLLRMMRAFRVFRLFKRVKSLNKIIVAIARAVPGVVNAFIILTIIMSIYAILGVEFFKDVGEGCHLQTSDLAAAFTSTRKFCVGEEYFGSFSRSLYSFFQVLTGESWSEMIARPMIWAWDDWYRALGAALFFVSFVIVSNFILANVVVAVLLDKMADAEGEEEEEEEEAAPAAPAVPEGPVVTLTPREKNTYRNSVALQQNLLRVTAKTASVSADFNAIRSDMAEVKDQLNALTDRIEKSRWYKAQRVPTTVVAL
jgi:hypothetical protein